MTARYLETVVIEQTTIKTGLLFLTKNYWSAENSLYRSGFNGHSSFSFDRDDHGSAGDYTASGEFNYSGGQYSSELPLQAMEKVD
ncbi:MAG: hypothetical protein Kow00127_10430 [Bacteroidales bacterium]